MEVQTKLNIKINDLDTEPKFKVLICNTKCNKNSFNGKILGLKLSEWVAFACENVPFEVVDYDKQSSLIDFAKKHVDYAYDYTIILLSNTPLITNDTIQNIIEYCKVKKIKLCKLNVGYVVNNEYLKSQENLLVDSIYTQNPDDFYLVENKSQFTYAFKILSERINNFHINNGVEILSPTSTYVEPFVDISSGVTIYPNNSLKGKTTLSDDVILKENNVIENSKIGKGSCISGSEINDTIVSHNVYIASFCEIKNCIIGNDVIIEKGCSLKNTNIASNQKIKTNGVIDNTNDSDSGVR